MNIIVSCTLYTKAYRSQRRKGEGAECNVAVIVRGERKISIIRGSSIQKSDGSGEEAALELIVT